MATSLLASPFTDFGMRGASASTAASAGRGTLSPLELTIRRLPDSLELVVVGTGPSPLLTQTRRGNEWQGALLINVPKAQITTPRNFSLPEAGVKSTSLVGGGTQFNLSLTTLPGVDFRSPEISADGENLIVRFPLPSTVISQTARPNLAQPATVPMPAFAPPLQPRAVAPPLGDMAVGSMVLRNQSFVRITGPSVTLTLRNAPAKDALMAVAQLGGYGFVFVGDSSTGSATSSAPAANASATGSQTSGRAVTLSFRNENYAHALNSILLASGLQGKLEGRTLLVGENVLGKTFGPQVSKIYRLNQATAASAADYLASLGASISKINTLTSTTSSSDAEGTPSASASNTTSVTEKITTVETYGAMTGPLVGVSGTTDSRLQTVTLIGDAALVAVAENYLRQIDLRQRQVAVKVQILNIDLENNMSIDSSFSALIGDTFLVNQGGKAFMNFGQNKPGGSDGTGVIQNSSTPFASPGVYEMKEGDLPVYSQPNSSFYSSLEAAITSSNAKTLAQPTLLVQEGQKSVVKTATSVITGVNSTEASNGSVQLTNTREDAGLILDVAVNKIDDNGFVTLDLKPTVSVPIPAGDQQGVPIFNISQRSLSSGSVRLRDGQTLVLTGVIQDSDRQNVVKWPILGDMPIIGQLFRKSTNSRQRNELVILVTPSVVDDASGGVYGYGYRPLTQAAREIVR
ncbi:MAG: general secretion pathway protein GspD [Vulcanococcus sp.]|nr:general secretion pathway protein GspD [Vulcanococcus sp.]